MKSFLLRNNYPTIKFSMLPDNCFYEGDLPGKDYDLAVCPTNHKQVILDIDCKPGKDIGYYNIPEDIYLELMQSFHYLTKSGGMHIFLNYSGNKLLKNCSTKYSLDLRIGTCKETNNAGGYVRYNGSIPANEIEPLIKSTSPKINEFLEKLFS